jgi:hypothetical protein
MSHAECLRKRRGTATEIIGSSNEGATWKAQTTSSTIYGLEGVSCKYSSTCMVAIQDRKSFTSISGEVLVTSKLDGPWTAHTLPAADHAPASVSCGGEQFHEQWR